MMDLFKGDTIKKINKLVEKGEERKKKLLTKIEELKEDHEALYQAEQDDFNQAIIEGGEPSKKLRNDRMKVEEELKESYELLSKIDVAIESELKKSKNDVEKERRQFTQEKKEEFNELFAELNDLKLAYLNKLIEYHNKERAYVSEYRRTFQDIHNKLGLRMPDPRDHNKLFLHQRYQVAERYSPLIYGDEFEAALDEGKLTLITARNKNAFKK